MLIFTALLFACAAALGLYLITFILQNKNTPKGLVFIHGPLAATALIILIIYALFHSPAPLLSILLFLLTALGGLVLIFRDITGKPNSKWLAIGHGGFAIIAFVTLLVFIFSSAG